MLMLLFMLLPIIFFDGYDVAATPLRRYEDIDYAVDTRRHYAA